MRKMSLVCLLVFISPGLCVLNGCVMVDCGTVRHVSGTLRNGDESLVDGWVGASEREIAPHETYDSVSEREKWGNVEGTRLGLTHTRSDGRFDLAHGSGITWGYTLLFGFIPLGSTEPPEVPPLDQIYLHIHDATGWRTLRVDLTAEQQARTKPGQRWIDVGEVVVR